jgi:hypothetical protein
MTVGCAGCCSVRRDLLSTAVEDIKDIVGDSPDRHASDLDSP